MASQSHVVAEGGKLLPALSRLLERKTRGDPPSPHPPSHPQVSEELAAEPAPCNHRPEEAIDRGHCESWPLLCPHTSLLTISNSRSGVDVLPSSDDSEAQRG